jgi:O-antigen ligase
VLGFFAVAMIAWSIVLLPVGTLSPTGLRDAAPYLYAVIIFLVGPPGDSRNIRDAMGRAITIALVFHALWLTANTIDKLFWLHMPQFGKVYLFLPRPDVDSAVAGLLGVVGLHRALAGRAPLWNLALGGWGISLVFLTYSRAGLLAFGAQLLVLLFLSPARAKITVPGRRHWAPVSLAVLLLALPIGMYAAKDSVPVQRLIYGKGGAKQTAGARSESWKAIARYMDDDPVRLARGVGFGPDYLHDSGGDVELLNKTSDEVRAPHNYIINTWARLGLIGLIPLFGMLFAGIRLAFKLSRAQPDITDPDLLAMLLVVAMPVGATFGVILESPFGAVPYFWALGHLSVRCVQLGLVRPWGARIRPNGYEPTRPAPALAPAGPAALRGRMPRAGNGAPGRLPPLSAGAPGAEPAVPSTPQPASAMPPPSARSTAPARPENLTVPGPAPELAPPAPAAEEIELDLNRATFEDLRGLGLSHTQSARLIARRDAKGGFTSLEELGDLPGFSEQVVARLKRRVRVWG